MTADVPPEQRFRSAPYVTLDREEFRIAWPHSGHSVALDRAAATLLDCFGEPVSCTELAEDLVDALGLDRAEALRSIVGLVAQLIPSGHLLPAGSEPQPSEYYLYPPAASP